MPLLNNIILTLGSRILVVMLNILLLFLTTNIMGAEQKGMISLLTLNLSIVALFSGFVGGPSLVYLTPRYKLTHLLALAYSWSILIASCATWIYTQYLFMTELSSWQFFRLALFESLVSSNLMILLGRKLIGRHNLILVTKPAVVVVFLFVAIGLGNEINFNDFANGYEWSLYACTGISAVFMISTSKTDPVTNEGKPLFWNILRLGFFNQSGNLAQMLNYRLSYYLLEALISPPELALVRIGIFSASVQIAESLWNFSRSVSTVQYSYVANIEDQKRALHLSLGLARMNLVATAVGIILLALLPTSVYTAFLGDQFTETKSLIILLSPGILALAVSGAFSHYFSGIGKPQFNTLASVLGLGLTLLVAYPAIKFYDIAGAAAASALVYTGQTILQALMLKKSEEFSWSELIPKPEDFDRLLTAISRILK
ncbi:MAG: hypothetical protein Kow0075_01980 [Salibacteraceae bacterium]